MEALTTQLLGGVGLVAGCLVVVKILWDWGNGNNNKRITQLESTIKVLESKLEKCEAQHDTAQKSREETLIEMGKMQAHIEILERLAAIPVQTTSKAG